MEEIYANDDSVCNISVVKDRGSSSSKKRLYVVIIFLGILSVGLLTGLISLGFHKKTCPAGWSMFSGSCHVLSTTSGAWYEARADCRTRGGDLVVINDADEQKFVLTLTETSTWIGLTDQVTEGSWKWVDGTPLSSQLSKFWGQNQPDNGGGYHQYGEEDCAHIWNNYKKWNDVGCGNSYLWICEKAPE
ncbi:C-type lectin domain family 4 member F-like [Poecilia reticulata]|uniref:C-type lectin domain family 4 member F-like n=1 Tax=Poecilia reticulata TaxID=8081 RepID=A0A3P9N8M7_POERE|nr:PREDICTED: C-type lectin domain family 4 member F-like [Poecilia reticulata]XP_008431085.1 PREDICTED: C-type lectin domain family 4 member F-like [Poecilia reticulata]XP_017164265.1 PREDICTED: C-type lectin domain family 4 member F-like [Poecilia reticulata]